VSTKLGSFRRYAAGEVGVLGTEPGDAAWEITDAGCSTWLRRAAETQSTRPGGSDLPPIRDGREQSVAAPRRQKQVTAS
jgi:hypothetical protein